MTTTAAIYLSLPPQTRRFPVAITAPFRSTYSPPFDSLRSNISLKTPNFRVSASSMSIGTPEKISMTSFLERRESGFLQFVKYHGLGNDFILVMSLIHFSWLRKKCGLYCLSWLLVCWHRLIIGSRPNRELRRSKRWSCAIETLVLELMEWFLQCRESTELIILWESLTLMVASLR